jgi:hypothetical protein
MDEKVKDWKQQMFEVRKIGPEPALTRPPWKKFKPVEIKASGSQESKSVSS